MTEGSLIATFAVTEDGRMIFTSPHFELESYVTDGDRSDSRYNMSGIDSGPYGRGLLTYLHFHCSRYLIIVALDKSLHRGDPCQRR